MFKMLRKPECSHGHALFQHTPVPFWCCAGPSQCLRAGKTRDISEVSSGKLVPSFAPCVAPCIRVDPNARGSFSWIRAKDTPCSG